MPAIQSSTQTPQHSPRKHQPALKPAPAPAIPPATVADRFLHDLLQKVEQMTKFFELEVIHSWEEKQAAEDTQVAAQKAEADAKATEGKIHKHMAKGSQVSHVQELYGLSIHVGWKDIPAHLKEKPMMAAKLKELHKNKHVYIPWYTCPVVTCQTFVDRKPIEVAVAKHMIGVVNAVVGAPVGQVDSGLLLQHGNIWADVFYEEDIE
ncbi:hypothetical protein F5J12DRAFT_782149 [Pisolithus orientalis]|uniref:uncharacterized protein n=1 Tax=Pisolithus orientalis TaxID=936130 RepID=UPI00222466FD|nr:uncharacterized protein F5J12DRAFT_782149 [Pisolithus orientalis]KAI6008680.1 hypothetical protein F5J12DRAFT_782149 [Pisolithus orientalis]